MDRYLDMDPAVYQAIQNNKPVIALESSFIAHGLPHPANLQTALEMIELVRKEGAVPAVTALVKGRIKVGLKDLELEELAEEGGKYFKVAASEVGIFLSKGTRGATTVSGTIYGAYLAGISICATGGIGGVHREVSRTFDISQDLIALSRFPVAVVSSGAKIILDLKLTLEYLETMGVPVMGYKTNYFPAFYSSASSYPLENNLKSSREAAEIIKVYQELGWKGGLLFVNPVPREDSLSPEFINSIVDEALQKANKENIKGKSLTPFLLKHLNQETEGECLKANISLLKNNALLAARIARAYYD
ncbi:MAG: pseudouridine-5'-phosphate glycosidase [Candidatus Syntrophonatronum acetioxidans]|uniref:Pseudouridine-5'-phosphate glycosidase n=1 Tax=Candidatus Syntrophonatronum acetioxidans TaxID=1795816 RepID=A0A424YFG9_9FIRM|nr:MAG: pseudouridine-5'-phosphate glycosidase [Candidatus Syntrophonatronum acetioxidans]